MIVRCTLGAKFIIKKKETNTNKMMKKIIVFLFLYIMRAFVLSYDV